MRTKSLPLFPLFLLSGSLFAQGSLEPADVPGPTMKSLDQIEPRTPVSAPGTLSESGSYYLTQSIAGPVVIDADYVVFDLNGYTITGGIDTIDLQDHSHIRIFNGRLENSPLNYGVDSSGSGHVYLSDLIMVNYYRCIHATNVDGPYVVERVTCDTAQSEGLQVFASDDDAASFRVVDNIFSNTSLAETDAAIRVVHQGTGNLEVVITGNRILESSYSGIAVAAVGDAQGLVADNFVVNCANTGISVNGDPVVTRNVVQGCATNYDLGVGAPNSAPVTAITANPGAWDNISE